MKNWLVVFSAAALGVGVGVVTAQSVSSWWMSSYKRIDPTREIVTYRSSNGNEVFCSEVTSPMVGYATSNLKTISCTEIH